jgi:FMN-dependent NADH-azoreductase
VHASKAEAKRKADEAEKKRLADEAEKKRKADEVTNSFVFDDGFVVVEPMFQIDRQKLSERRKKK